MPRFPKEPLFDEATLKRIDEEYLAGRVMKSDESTLESLDPNSDPFGMNYAWLGPPGEFVQEPETYPQMYSRSQAANYRLAASALRRTALAGSLAGGTDAEIFQQWLGKGFVGLCHEAGPKGVELLETIRGDRELLPERIEAIRGVFRETLPAASFTAEEEIAIATAIVQALMLPL